MSQTVLVELRVPVDQHKSVVMQQAAALKVLGFQVDPSYEPVPMGQPSDSKLANELKSSIEEIVIVRGTIEAGKIDDLKAHTNVVDVWMDTPIAPFTEPGL